MAQGRDILLKLTGDPTDAQNAIRRVAEKVQEFARLKAEATLGIDTAKADLDIDHVKAKLATLHDKKVEVKVDVDRSMLGTVGAAVSAIGESLARAFSSGGGSGGGIGGIISQAGASLGGMGAAALSALPAIAAIGAAIAVLSAIVISLVASLTAAIAGLAVIATTIAAAFGPVALVGIATLVSFVQQLKDKHSELFKTITEVKKELQNAFGPATRAVISGVVSLLKSFVGFFKDPAIKAAITGIGVAIGGFFRSIGTLIKSANFKATFAALAEGGAKLIPILGNKIFLGFLDILTHLARVAMPIVVRLMNSAGDSIQRFARGLTDQKLKGFIDSVITSFRRWWDLIKAVFNVLKELFSSGKGAGDSLVQSLTNTLNGWADWLGKHKNEVHDFFKTAADFARGLFTILKLILPLVGTVFGALVNIAKVLNAMVETAKQLVAASETDKKTIGVYQGIISNPKASPEQKADAQRRIDELKRNPSAKFQRGGTVPGWGSGDHVPILAEPGEFILRKSIAQSIGIGNLHALNSGRMPAMAGAGGRGMTIEQQHVHLPAAPGHDQLGDPRHQAVMFAREMKRRGGGRI